MYPIAIIDWQYNACVLEKAIPVTMRKLNRTLWNISENRVIWVTGMISSASAGWLWRQAGTTTCGTELAQCKLPQGLHNSDNKIVCLGIRQRIMQLNWHQTYVKQRYWHLSLYSVPSLYQTSGTHCTILAWHYTTLVVWYHTTHCYHSSAAGSSVPHH